MVVWPYEEAGKAASSYGHHDRGLAVRSLIKNLPPGYPRLDRLTGKPDFELRKDAIRNLADKFRHYEKSKRESPEPIRPTTDLEALQLIRSLLERHVRNAHEYWNAIEELPGADSGIWPPPEFDLLRYGALKGLYYYNKLTFQYLSNAFRTWRDSAKSTPDSEQMAAFGRTTCELAIEFQDIAERLLDLMIPKLRWAFFREIYIEDDARQMIEIELVAWTLAHFKVTDRLSQSLKHYHHDADSDDALLNELITAVPIVAAELGPQFLWPELVSKVRREITRQLGTDGINRNVGAARQFKERELEELEGEDNVKAWTDKKIDQEAFQEMLSAFGSIQFRGGMGDLNKEISLDSDLFDDHGRLDEQELESRLGRDAGQINTEWDRMKARLRRAM